MNRTIFVCLAASTLTLTGHAPAPLDAISSRAEVTRNVYISATDSNNAPVTDLTAADITVKEGGKDRAVSSLQPASAPMHLAIIVDDAGIGAFQPAMAQFLPRVVGKGPISITLLNPQATRILDFSEDVGELKTALGRLGSRARAQADGDQMLDAIVQASKSLQQRKAERPVILALTVAGGRPQSVDPLDVLSQVRSTGAALNVIFVTGADLGMVMGDGPKQSGGRLEQAGTATAITSAALRIAAALQNQYLLTYTLPDGVKMSDRIAVATSRKGVVLTAPSRIADK